MAYFSNQLKAVLFPDTFLEESSNVNKRNCYTVQHFSYKCQRNRNEAGIPYGDTVPSEMQFTIRLTSTDDGKRFYNQMQQNEYFDYTFLFNATYNASGVLQSYEDVMVVSGYVVDVWVDYDNMIQSDGTEEQVLLKVNLLLCSVKYFGKEEKYKLLEINRY